MDEALRALEAQLNAIEDALDACTTQEQRNQLRPSYIQAQLNYQRAVNKIFQANDPQITQLVAQMKQAQTSLQKLTQQLADFAKIVSAVSTAVRIGTELASMAK
jgi:predicted  nucleic acid-binding Zn-ribbon protein